MGYLLRGILIGLIFGVPAGAIGALAVQHSMERGFLAGVITGVGSSVADVLYGCAGVFGISVISDFMLAHQKVTRIAGGIFITVLGAVIGRKKNVPQAEAGNQTKWYFCFSSSFVVAVMNPATILSFLAAFAAFQIEKDLRWMQGMGLIAGIFTGTMCWWCALSGIVTVCRKRVTDRIYLSVAEPDSWWADGFAWHCDHISCDSIKKL